MVNFKIFLLKEKLKKYDQPIKWLLLTILVVLSVNKRIQYFSYPGKDIYAYEKAISDLISGVNPYIWTIESFSNPDDPGNHGYAYFPGTLYIFTPLYIFHLQTGIPHYLLWKIPVLLADIGVGVLLFYFFRKKSLLSLLTALLIWFYNPYSFLKSGYTYTEPLTIFFLFLSLILLEKDDVLSGTFYALSIAMKTFPYILFPVMLLKAKDKRSFLLAGMLVGLVVSIPFLKSVPDFMTYLNGTLFVHQNRFIQGRPFLFYISYYYNIELFQIIPFGVYTMLASFSGWILASLLYLLKITRDKYILALVPFLTFYLFTPVFNRTYFIWFIPVYVTATYKMFEQKHRFLFYLSQILFFAFGVWYLAQWKDGFHIWHP